MAINEQDAFQVFNAYKANLIPDELKPKAKQMLDDYRSQQVQRMQSVFSDLKTLDAEDGSFITADRFSPGAGDKLRKKEANILWLSNRYNAPETDVRKRYDLYKAEAATEWGQAGLDDESFFLRASQEVGKQKKQIQLIQSAQEAAFLSAVNGGDDVADFSAWQFANPDPESFTGTARSAWEEERKRTLNRLGPDGQGLAARVVRSLRHETGVAREEDAWLNQTVEMLTQLKATDPDKYNLVMAVANAKAQKAAKPEKAVAEGAVEAFGRSSADIIAGIPRFLVEASAEGSARFVESGQDRVLSKIGLPVSENPELLAKRIRGKQEVLGDLKDLAEGVIDPIESKRKGWAKYAEDAVYMASGSAPTMIAAMIPGGQAALTGMFANESYEDFRRAGWDGPGALGAALATGRIQAAIERVSESAMAIPGVASWMAKYGAKPGMSFVKTFLARTVTRSISEGAEEALQQATAPAAQELGSAIFASIPDRPEGQKLKDVMSEFMKLDNSIPLMLSILPLGALGAGMSTQNDMVLVATITRDPRLLRAVMSEAEAKKIEQEANPQVRAEMIKKAWQAAPTSDIVARIKALVQDDAKRVEEAKNVLAEAEKTGLIPRIRRDAEGWKVEQNGQMVRVDSREAAVQMAYSSLDDLERQQYESMALVADELLNDKEAMEISGSQQTLKGLVDAKLITPQEAAKRAQLAAQMAGMTQEEAQNASWIVLGKNTIEQINNVRTAVSRIYHGANVITQIHEHAHGRWATALNQGYLTHDDGVQFVRLAEQATGLQFLPVADDAKVSPQMLDEAIVEVVSADTVGRRKTDKRFTPGVISRGIAAFIKSEKQQQLRKRVAGKMDGRGLARFKAFMSSYRVFWGVVLRNARALKKARDEGKIGEDFDTFLEALLGTDTQTRVEAEAIQEVGQMVEEVDNQPFSLAPARTAQDAEYLTAVQAGDMEKAQRMVDEAAKKVNNAPPSGHPYAPKGSIDYIPTISIVKWARSNQFDLSKFTSRENDELQNAVAIEEAARQAAEIWIENYGGFIEYNPEGIEGQSPYNPVTYDDAGNVIPLSQRFQPESQDIRFSLARTAQDAEYLAALESKNFEKARKLYDKAAIAVAVDYPDSGYSNLPDNLLGFGNVVKGYEEEKYKTEITVVVGDGDDAFVDGIKGLNVSHAMARARRNWRGEKIRFVKTSKYQPIPMGPAVPLSVAFNSTEAFSLARATSLVEVADTILASRMKKPEFKEGFYIAARRRLEQLGKTILGAKIAGQRTPQNIEAERIFRLRSRQRELIDQGMAGLTPETMMAYSQGIESLKDHPFIIAMNRQGKLMKRSTAQKLGKLRTDGKGNAGDYDGAPALPPGFYSKGAGIMPFEMAQALYDDGMLSEPLADAFWNELSSVVTSVRTNNAEVKKATDTVREIERNALRQATQEANAWADEQMKLQPSDRDRQLGAIRTLNAILSAFSPAIRGEIVGGNMGFINLAELKTDAARAKEITRVLNKLEDILEREAKKYYTDKIDRMLERAQLKGKPGEIKKSDFIVTVQDELNLIQVAVDLDTDEVQSVITAAEAELMTADTPEKADSAMARMHLLETFGALFDEKNTTSAEMEVASDYLEQLMKQGREARRMLDEERRNKVKAYVDAASKDVFNGEIGPDTTQEARMKAAKKSGRTLLKKFFQEGLSYDLVLRYLFGADSKTAQEFGDRFILNSNAFEDTQNERRKRLRDFSRELYKTKLGARINQKLMALDTKQANTGVTYLKGREVVTHKMDLDQAAKVVADPKAFGFTAADAKAISAELDAINMKNADPTQRKVKRLVYEQTVKTGDRVEIPLSQMDALYLSMALRQPGILEQQERYGYDQNTVDELENFLTDEAKAWREWMQEEYDAEYDVANQVYMRLFNTRMPQIKFYAPLLKNHQGNQAALDPLNSGLVAQSANPGSIKSRKARTSSLRIESALDVFWSHFNQMDYWVHMAEYLRDVQSVMLNPTVRDAVVSKHGTEGMQTLNAWITLQLGRGVSKGALVVAGNRMIRNIKSAVSMKALALSLSTTLKTLPSMLYSLGEIHLSKWPAALASGMKHWSRLWNTNIIQRRLDIGGMPELRDLGNSALPMSWINQGIRYGSYPTMYADGVFTTYSAAMAYGVSFDDAKAQGASDEMAHKYAEERTALIVSKTAQPDNWTQKSLLENDASGAGTLFYMWTSDPRQKAALTFEVFNRLRKGEASLEEASRKFLAYWVIPGMMFQLANAVGRSLFKGDDDEWDVVDFATAALVGQAQGFLLIGSSLEMIVSAAVAAAAEAITGEEVKGKPFWNSPKNPLDQAAQEMVKAAQTLNEDDGKTGLEKAWQLGKAASMGMSWMTPAGAIPSTAERVFKDTSNLFYSEDD